MYPN